jgi:putative tricarboxylic transport membrane protein
MGKAGRGHILHKLNRRRVMKKVYCKVRGKRLVSLTMVILLLGFMAFVGVPVFAAPGADYPSKPVVFFCLSNPGTGFDTTTRAIVNALTKEKLVSVPMPVENNASAQVGLTLAATRFTGDPYMVSVNSLSGPLNYATGAVKYSHRDFTPLANLISTHYGIAVRSDSPYKTLGDLIKDLKEKPGKIPLCGGRSDDRIFYGATFLKAGLDPATVNYVAFSGPEASMSVLEGSCKAITITLEEITGLLEGKKLRLLAVSPGKRLEGPAFKDAPTLREAGVDFEFANRRYTFGGSAMPEYAVKYWQNIFTKMVKTPAWLEIRNRYQWDDAFQIEGLNDTLDKTQAVVTEVTTRLGMAKK